MSGEQFKALHRAIQIARKDKLHSVTSEFEKCLGQLLNAAANCGNEQCVSELIKAGADVNYEEESFNGNCQQAFAHYVTVWYKQHPPQVTPDDIVDKLCHECEECIQCLGQMLPPQYHNTLDIGYRHHLRKAITPLVLAIRSENVQCVKTLLKHGSLMNHDIGIDHVNVHLTPVSVTLLQGNVEVLQLFLDNGLNLIDIDIEIMHRVHDRCFPLLLKAGITTGWLRKDTPLTLAAGSQGGKVDDLCETKPYSLKHLARQVIRQQLLDCNRVNYWGISDFPTLPTDVPNSKNLFKTATVEHLPIPKRLCEYLLCEKSLH